jgi:omega-amidase
MQNLALGLVQAAILWEAPAANRQRFEQVLLDCRQQLDLIVLPEMFNSGFSMDASGNAESMDGDTIAWMRQMASRKQAAICGSLAIDDGGKIFNRLVFAKPDGTLHCYDKRHLFRMASEQDRYAAGTELITIDWRGWRIRPMVCYDLRFPVWSRNCEDYDLLLYVANWPQKRSRHWRQLLIARAIENLTAVVGVNRVGIDGNDIAYSGDSLAIDANGEVLLDPRDHIGLHYCVLDWSTQQDYRSKFPAYMDADSFSLDP